MQAIVPMEDAVRSVVMRFRWVAAGAICCAGLFAIWSLFQTPIYRATTVLAPANEGAVGLGAALGQFGGLAALAGIDLGAVGAETEEAIAVLKSREFTENFIRDHDLLPHLFPDRWDSNRATWRVSKSKTPSLVEGFRRFDKKVRSVSHDKRTGLIFLRLDWPDSEQVAVLSNDLVYRINQEMRSRAIRDSEAAIEFLEKEASATTTLATRDAISRLIEVQVKNRMMANVKHEYAFRVVDRALPADVRDPVRPRKALMILMGALLGSLLGVASALMVPLKLARARASG